jgi:hypothetical protein
MAETDVQQGTGANGAQGEKAGHEAETRQRSPDMPAVSESPEGHAADRARGRLIACLALAGGGAFVATRRARRARASQQRQRRWPILPAMRARKGRSRCAACGARTRKLRHR